MKDVVGHVDKEAFTTSGGFKDTQENAERDIGSETEAELISELVLFMTKLSNKERYSYKFLEQHSCFSCVE